MEPAHAPLPTCWNLPFQPLSGSHSSLLISESEDGVSVSWTRQKAGSPVMAFGASAPGDAGGVNWPPVTAVAALTFAFVNFIDAARVSQVSAPARLGSAKRQKTKPMSVMMRILAVVRRERRDLRLCGAGISQA